MSRLLPAVSLAVLVAGCGPQPAAPGPANSALPAQSVTLSGVVTGPTNRAVAGVRVDLIQGATQFEPVFTASDGSYQLVAKSGFLQVRFSKAGYAGADTTLSNVVADTNGINAKLQRGTWSVTGVVTDRNGSPVTSASIHLFVSSNPEAYSGSAETNSLGRFTATTSVRPADGWVRVDRNPWVTQQAAYTCQSPSSDPDAALCGDQQTLTRNVSMVKVIGVTLDGPGALAAGESPAVQRTVRLDDGRTISDNGSNSLFDDSISTTDPAIARILGGGGLMRLLGVAPGAVTLVTTVNRVRATLPVVVTIPR